jgi:hypothetical protein
LEINLILRIDNSGLSDGAAWFLICTSPISQHSPSESLCWQGDTGIAQSSQASVKPLKNLRGKIKWKERLRCHARCLGVSEALIPKRLQNLAKAVGPNGLVRPSAACSSVGTKPNFACTQHGSLIVKFHIKVLRPFMEFGIAR